MEAKAIQKYAVISPKKLREVAAVARKLTPQDARDRLPFIGKKAALPLVKVITAALANARQKGMKEDQLVFKEIQINEGPRLKRWRAGARGRGKPYKRLMSHIRVVLAEKEAVKTSEKVVTEKPKKIKESDANKGKENAK